MRSGIHNRTRDRGREPIRINGGGHCPPVLPEPGRGRSLKGALEARGILTRLSVRRHRGRFLNAFVLAAKATIGRACEGAGHAQRHQKLAVGIDADALGGLCQLAKLPDALRSGARLRMCTIHDGESELGRLPLLRKSFPAPTARALREMCGCDYFRLSSMRPESKAGSTSSPPVKPSHIAVPRVRVRLMAGANELNSTG
jgi:hypothetical protein